LEATRLDFIDERVCEVLVNLLRLGKNREVRTLGHTIYEADPSAGALADQLVRPVMERVGRSWMVGAKDIYQEHQATHLLASCLIELIDRVSREQEGPAPLALGAASEGDFFVLPGLLGELFLRESDWDVRNLGVILPLRSLATAVLEDRPRLVLLALSYLVGEERFMRESPSFHENAVARGMAVIVGGQVLCPDFRDEPSFTSASDRMAHLSEFARRLHPGALTTFECVRDLNGSTHS
jgi:MerR family transcriptional regulator, light-induced transcriptional regulator